jgi:hypothetical protein
MQARSVDGGQTWELQKTPCCTPGDRGLSADEHVRRNLGVGQALETANTPVDCPGGIDFTHPDFAMMCARSGLKAGAKSWFYISYDRCRMWEGPFSLPMFGQTGIAARTDYVVSGSDECTLFLTAAKPNGDEGRVFCAQTTDGGKTFEFVSWIGPEPEGFTIMPASVQLSESLILVAVRCREAQKNWVDLYSSDDNGATWEYMNRPVASTGTGGNPPTMTKLHDGRLCLTYGYRDAPYSMRAKFSTDDGATWGKEIILHDLEGYCPGDINLLTGEKICVGTKITDIKICQILILVQCGFVTSMDLIAGLKRCRNCIDFFYTQNHILFHIRFAST